MPLVSLKKREMEILYEAIQDQLELYSSNVKDLQHTVLWTKKDAEELAQDIIYSKAILDKLVAAGVLEGKKCGDANWAAALRESKAAEKEEG
jgi:hypothetical protein